MLLTDEKLIAEHTLTGGFAQRHAISERSVAGCAESVEGTGLYQFFEAAAKLLHEQTRPNLFWLHSRGMSGAWDAPLELRYQFADEEDPEPPDFVVPPNAVLPQEFDPDGLL